VIRTGAGREAQNVGLQGNRGVGRVGEGQADNEVMVF
jgi:hypothetical protein